MSGRADGRVGELNKQRVAVAVASDILARSLRLSRLRPAAAAASPAIRAERAAAAAERAGKRGRRIIKVICIGRRRCRRHRRIRTEQTDWTDGLDSGRARIRGLFFLLSILPSGLDAIGGARLFFHLASWEKQRSSECECDARCPQKCSIRIRGDVAAPITIVVPAARAEWRRRRRWSL